MQDEHQRAIGPCYQPEPACPPRPRCECFAVSSVRVVWPRWSGFEKPVARSFGTHEWEAVHAWFTKATCWCTHDHDHRWGAGTLGVYVVVSAYSASRSRELELSSCHASISASAGVM